MNNKKNSEQANCAPEDESDLKFGHALLLFQEKWYLFILHALLQSPMGFNELARCAKQVNPRTLSDRMQTLEKLKLVSKEVVSTIPPKTTYALTEAGQELTQVFEAIRQWSDKNGWTSSQ